MATRNSRSPPSTSDSPPDSPAKPRSSSAEDPHNYENTRDLTDLCKHCLLHSIMLLATTPNRKADVAKTDQFCHRLLGEVQRYRKKKKRGPLLQETQLVPEVEMLRFYEGAISVKDFTKLVSQQIMLMTGDDFEEGNIYQICWEVYAQEMRASLAYPKWLSGESTYRLWLIFNALLSKLRARLDVGNFNDIIQVMYKYVGYTWNTSSGYQGDESVSFVTFLEVMTRYFDLLKLGQSFVSEITNELYEKFVMGVLFKGYLIKKGHRVANRKRRWFTLQRRVIKYYLSREQPVLKGKIVLNTCTQVKELDDKDKTHKHRFLVTCGDSGIPYEMCAETNRERNEWILEIRKAIELEKAISETSTESLTQSLATFNKLKYATSQPTLKRVDSSIRHATVITVNPIKKERAELLAKMQFAADYEHPVETGRNISTDKPPYEHTSGPNSPIKQGQVVEQEEYLTMDSANDKVLEDTDSDEDGYTFMYKGLDYSAPVNPHETESAMKGREREDKSMSMSPVHGSYDGEMYSDCNFDTPRYVAKRRDDSTTSHTSSSSISDTSDFPATRKDTDSSLELSKSQHLENVSDYLGSDGYLPILPSEVPSSPPTVPPRSVRPSTSASEGAKLKSLSSKSMHARSTGQVKPIHYRKPAQHTQPLDDSQYYILPPTST